MESCRYAAIDKKTSEDFTLTLKLKKSWSSKIFIFLNALSTKASGQGSLNFSKISFSKDPALTPILTEHPLFFAALKTSWIFTLSPIFPKLRIFSSKIISMINISTRKKVGVSSSGRYSKKNESSH